METSRESQLKTYEVVELVLDTDEGSYDILSVTCPNCNRAFWVGRVWGTIFPSTGRSDQPDVYVIGRSCPYGDCHKSSFIPEEFRIDPRQQELPVQPRRIVRRRKSKARQ